jgi:hypothetical protein
MNAFLLAKREKVELLVLRTKLQDLRFNLLNEPLKSAETSAASKRRGSSRGSRCQEFLPMIQKQAIVNPVTRLKATTSVRIGPDLRSGGTA